MRNTCRFFGLLVSYTWLLSGCSSVYMPNVPNTPMFTQKGEISAGGHATLKGNFSINGAYAVSDHFGVMMNGSRLNNHRKKEDFRHSLFEVGGGYFTSFGANKSRVLEAYAGIGRGSSDRTEKNTETEEVTTYNRISGNYDKYFLQVNFTSKRKKDLRLFGNSFPLNYGTALRMSYIDMYRHVRDGEIKPTEDNIFLEPIFYTRLAFSPAVQLQYTSGGNFGLKNRKALTAGYSVFSLGLVINIWGRNVSR
ncbi:MAG: hypothetical protein M3142_04830 [Bacteroidota bacterium]|nr:hypothetical protein [Bacteroidota bacterium]